MSIIAALLIAQAPTPVVLSPPGAVAPPSIDTVASPPPKLDVAVHPRAATPAGNPGEWVTTDDYPITALDAMREGIASFHLTVDSMGRVSGCTISSSSGSPDLDAATCRLVSQRARFLPATDPKGVAIVGVYSGRVRWMIPEDPTPDPFFGPDGRFVSNEVTYRFFVEPDGTTSDCVLITNDTAEVLEQPEGPCLAKTPYKPFIDAKGKPVRKRVSVTVKIAVEDPPQP